MGISCSKRGTSRHGSYAENIPEVDPIDPTSDLQQLEKLLQAMQAHNLKRMKYEIDTDIHTFILNNLLMCIQFFDNFERSKELASQFKRKKESELNHKLSHEPMDRGTILGERRCHLLHGMSQVLAKNYIYRPPDNAPISDYAAGGQIYGMDSRNTFICEGILPLEFFMTWDNLELYQSSEWDSLQAMQYSAAKGSVQILRFCMEEPDETNKVPKGFLRLRSVDVTADIYKSGTDSSYDYAYHNGRYSDRDQASEADTASHDGISDVSDIDKDELMSNMRESGRDVNSNKYPNYKQRNSLRPEELRENPQSNLNPELAHKAVADRLLNKRSLGGQPLNYLNGNSSSRLSMPDPVGKDKNEYSVPSVRVDLSNTPPVQTSNAPMFQFPQSHSLIPPQSTSKFGRHSFSMNGIGGSSTSGHGMSRSSSLASEDIRFKWQQLELKQLAQFPLKNRVKADLELEKHEPLSFHCFIPVKTEIVSDSEDESDSESVSSYSSEGSDSFHEIRYQERYYLNSTHFSSEFCSEFYHVGIKLGIPPDTLSRAVILGTTVRCSVPYQSEFGDQESYQIVHTFTPSLHSKYWPPSYYFWFNQRMFNKKITPGHTQSWPTLDQVESIEKLGANAIPIGFRSPEFFNTHQSLEWQLNFGKAETLLLNSFKLVHWRAYIFASLIFRAFLAPLGPQGIGVEHIRNILYFMCHEDFVGWNDEQPGLHLRTVLSKLFDCLGKGKMPNFFVQSQDLLKSVPPQNARLIQAHLSHLRDNLIVYCIYAFRNLTCLKQQGELFPTPNFKKLYEIITVPTEIDVIRIQTPHLAASMEDAEEDQRKEKQHKSRRRKSEKPGVDLISQEDVIEGAFKAEMTPHRPQKHDKQQSKLRRRHIQWEQAQREQKARERDLQRQKGPPEAKIPTPERRKSIDLKKLPVIKEKFSVLRKVLMIDFFIKHFLKMAKKCNEHRAYSQSAMYIMQVENLCTIISTYDLGTTSVDAETIEEYREECSNLRQIVGREMLEYVQARFSHLNLPSMTSNNIIGELSRNRGPFQNNWDFRKLPTPPGSHIDEAELRELTTNQTKRTSITKKLEAPNIAMSLQSFNSGPSEKAQQKPVRQESIIFVDKARVLKRSTSRQSVVLMEKESESTDL